MVKILIPNKYSISQQYFRSAPEAIKVMTEIQHYRLGEGGDGFKIKGIARVKGAGGYYSSIYEPIKKKFGRKVSNINFKLSGKLHESFRFIPKSSEASIFARAPYLKSLMRLYPQGFKISKGSIDKIIHESNQYNKTPLIHFVRLNLRKIISR